MTFKTPCCVNVIPCVWNYKISLSHTGEWQYGFQQPYELDPQAVFDQARIILYWSCAELYVDRRESLFDWCPMICSHVSATYHIQKSHVICRSFVLIFWWIRVYFPRYFKVTTLAQGNRVIFSRLLNKCVRHGYALLIPNHEMFHQRRDGCIINDIYICSTKISLISVELFMNYYSVCLYRST